LLTFTVPIIPPLVGAHFTISLKHGTQNCGALRRHARQILDRLCANPTYKSNKIITFLG